MPRWKNQAPPNSHEKQREIIAGLASQGLSVEQIASFSGFTRVAVEHHLWFLEHLRQQAAKETG